MQKCDQEKKKNRETKMFIIMWKYTIWKFYILMRPIWWHCEKCNNQFSSVAQSWPTLCDPMDGTMPGLLSITNSQSLLKLMSIESVMPSNDLLLCRPLLLLPSIFPSIRSFPMSQLFAWGGQSIGSFSFSISPSDEHSMNIQNIHTKCHLR